MRYNKPRQQSAQQFYCEECEKRILVACPELRGKFTELKIWDTLNYAFQWNKTIPEIVESIVKSHHA